MMLPKTPPLIQGMDGEGLSAHSGESQQETVPGPHDYSRLLCSTGGEHGSTLCNHLIVVKQTNYGLITKFCLFEVDSKLLTGELPTSDC